MLWVLALGSFAFDASTSPKRKRRGAVQAITLLRSVPLVFFSRNVLKTKNSELARVGSQGR